MGKGGGGRGCGVGYLDEIIIQSFFFELRGRRGFVRMFFFFGVFDIGFGDINININILGHSFHVRIKNMWRCAPDRILIKRLIQRLALRYSVAGREGGLALYRSHIGSKTCCGFCHRSLLRSPTHSLLAIPARKPIRNNWWVMDPSDAP